jgi:hypothetical protein
LPTSDNGTENESFSGDTDSDLDKAVEAADSLYRNGFRAGKDKACEYISYEMEYGDFTDWPEVQQTLTTLLEKLGTLNPESQGV